MIQVQVLLRSARLAALVACAAAASPLALAAPAPAPAAAPARDLPDVPFERYTLPNGLTVVLHVDRTAPIVGVHVQYDVGAKNEKPGRTGFAHLFEHLMFQGTVHVPKGEADRLVEAAGGDANGSTSQDTTQYWSQVPSNALEQMLFVEADRMGFLLPTLDQAKLDNQRDVVRNERRQNYEMQPYGLAFQQILAALWEPTFPYHWMPIGTHEDLEAATLDDVREFFERWYGPENAVLSIAGDFDVGEAKRLVERWFGGIPGGPRPDGPVPAPAPVKGEQRLVLEDTVQLPRLYLAWQTPRLFAPGDAALDVLGQILSDGKSARLVKRMVMDERTAQGVSAGQMSQALASMFLVVATPRPGVPVEKLERTIDEELLRLAKGAPSREELERAKNKLEAGAVFSLEPVGGFGGRAATLANYQLRAGDPGYLHDDLARYRAVTGADVSAAAREWLRKDRRVVLTVIPKPAAADAPRTTPPPGAPPTPPAAGTAGGGR